MAEETCDGEENDEIFVRENFVYSTMSSRRRFPHQDNHRLEKLYVQLAWQLIIHGWTGQM